MPSALFVYPLVTNTGTVTLCWEENEILQSMPGLTGWVLLSPEVHFQDEAYYLSLSTGLIEGVPKQTDETYARFAVSPDSQRFAYERTHSITLVSELVITNKIGDPTFLIPLDQAESRFGWWGYWVNNEWILIRSFPKIETNAEINSERLVNPFTGEEKRYEPWGDFTGYSPSWYTGPPTWPGLAIYSPNLNWALYPGQGDGGYFFQLRDLKRNSFMRDFSGINFLSAWKPKWSHDGEAFASVLFMEQSDSGSNELFIGTPGGVLEQVTYPIGSDQKESIGNFSWAPDDRKIAFWLWNNQGKIITLSVLDVASRVITNTCIEAGYYFNPPYPPLWSADSRYIAVGNQTTINDPPQIVIFDTVQNKITKYKSVENNDPVGWLSK